MFDILAGQIDTRELPGHMHITRNPDDFETYAEAELSDAELLAVAASDAVDAVEAGELAGELAFAEVDELALRRVLRTARQRVGAALEVIA